MRAPTIKMTLTALPFVFWAGLTGCSGSESSDSDGSAGSSSSGDGDAPATCSDWKEAYCSFFDECSSNPTCREDLADEECTENAPLDRCVEGLSQGCDSVPSNCDPNDVFELNTAIGRCYDFVNLYCESLAICDETLDLAQCVADAESQVNCAGAVYTTANFDACTEALSDDTCESELPEICHGVVIKL